VGFKKSSSNLGGLIAFISDCEQIGHRPRLLYEYLVHSLDIANPVMEGINDLNVLDVRDSIPDIADTFHVVPKALIRLLLDGLQSLYNRWMFVCTLKVPYEHGT
jgi:hypothetical protein